MIVIDTTAAASAWAPPSLIIEVAVAFLDYRLRVLLLPLIAVLGPNNDCGEGCFIVCFFFFSIRLSFHAFSGNGMMSRRRISVKELGQPDHQGWLYRKKESTGFLGIKWKKYWFVLKKTSLYWYTNPQVRSLSAGARSPLFKRVHVAVWLSAARAAVTAVCEWLARTKSCPPPKMLLLRLHCVCRHSRHIIGPTLAFFYGYLVGGFLQ